MMHPARRLIAPTAAIGAVAFWLTGGCNAITGVDGLVLGGGGSGTTATTGVASGGASGAGGGGHGGAAGGGPTGAGGHGGSTSDPCAGVTCAGHGTCSVNQGMAACACDPGYHPTGATCVVDETCAGKTCGDCASCEVHQGIATCVCPPDYALQGNDCKLAIDPCANANCQPDQFCVPEAHCQALGACVQICDCSNCPNCGPDNSDGKWDDWQEYCGAAINTSPATMACNKPCPPGEGCLPYQTQICWPIEGCFSL
ncbi:MAG: hypothetical protein U0359_24265 [Byssovorax sp.]